MYSYVTLTWVCHVYFYIIYLCAYVKHKAIFLWSSFANIISSELIYIECGGSRFQTLKLVNYCRFFFHFLSVSFCYIPTLRKICFNSLFPFKIVPVFQTGLLFACVSCLYSLEQFVSSILS